MNEPWRSDKEQEPHLVAGPELWNPTSYILNSKFHSEQRSKPTPGRDVHQDKNRLEAETYQGGDPHLFVFSVGALFAEHAPGGNKE